MKFKKIIGYKDDSTYIEFEIENGDNSNLFTDAIYINPEGNKLLISDFVEEEELEELIELFEPLSKIPFKGALRIMKLLK